MQLAVSKGEKRKPLFNQKLFIQDPPANDLKFVLNTKFFSNVERWFFTQVAKMAYYWQGKLDLLFLKQSEELSFSREN